MNKETADKISKLADKAYDKINEALDYNDYNNLERGVSEGLEDILEIKRITEGEKSDG